ncbi:MFS transporter [Bradyrhizobium sp. LVM 105]|uniref:MFS transporter n=1 Tax=Bradyrhizobium sp. LVM 105 TaxID=2341115 RepID=UPI000F810AC5|nr:MFS transporter [Bradyrhizobium sp. LVM 105]RTE91333.1 MFS transporter [Bradyrhizobium sp. LVM 105]
MLGGRATLSERTVELRRSESLAEPLESAVPSGPQVRTITAAAMGTVFEWYEFTLYAAMASILAAKFFSGLDPSISFIFALLTFGVGFVVRPFGAIFFGRLGDLIGRKRTFMITIVIMGLSTFAVGLLPIYETAGIFAPILLVTLRVLQGLALGGEYGGAVIYVTEHVERNKRGLSTSFIQMTGTLGFLTALLSIQLVQALASQSAFDAWAWRIPFLISIVLLGLSVRVRLQMHESPVFQRMAEQKRLSGSPVRETFGSRQNLKLLAIALIGIGGGMSVVYYNAVLYPLFFLSRTLNVPMPVANLVTTVAAFCSIPMIWFAGWLSDRLGRKPVILAGFILGLVATFPIFHQIANLANPALAKAQAETLVSIQTDTSGCSFMFNPLGNRKFTSPCDVARQVLSAASVNYTRVDRPGSPVTEVRVGDWIISVGAPESLNQASFSRDLMAAVKQAGFGAAGNPDGLDQAKIVGLLLVLLLAMALGYAPVGVAMAEMFPARIRYTAMSFPYHFSSGWIGGLLPTFAFAIAVAQGNIFAGLWYTIGWLIVGIVVTGLFYREKPMEAE